MSVSHPIHPFTPKLTSLPAFSPHPHPSSNLSIYMSFHHLPISLSSHLFISSIHLFIHPTIHPSVHSFIQASIFPSIHPIIHPSVHSIINHPSIHPSTYLPTIVLAVCPWFSASSWEGFLHLEVKHMLSEAGGLHAHRFCGLNS